MATPADIERGISHLVARLPDYDKYEKYYLGDHETKFASDAYRKSFGKLIKRLQYNRCSSVVDAFADRLQIESWQDESAQTAADRESRDAVAAWRQVRGDELAGMVHAEHIKMGDAYLIVWPDEIETQRPLWRMQQAERCGMVYDEETAEPRYGFKLWPTKDSDTGVPWRLTIYADDVITRWITRGSVHSMDNLKPDQFIAFGEEGIEQETPNPYETLPMFHFRNNPEHQTAYGRSELADVMGLQDAINYAVWSLMVGMEFTAWPQKVAIGVERIGDEDEDIDAGVDRWLTIGNQLANVFSIPGAPLEPFSSAIDQIDKLISRVTGIPVHWMGVTSVSDNVSGETVKALEAPFTSTLADRKNGLDAPWSGAMALDQRIRKPGSGAEASGSLLPIWKASETRSDMETWSIAQLKKNAGVPESQLWKEGGYSQEQIQAFEEENQRIADLDAERFAKQFASGGNDGFGDEDGDGA